MNKTNQTNTPQCEVTGIMLNAAHEPIKQGKLTITPNREASVNGVYFSKGPIYLTTDEHGRWRAALLPSKYAGHYKITFADEATVVIEVPDDRAKVPYTELLKNA